MKSRYPLPTRIAVVVVVTLAVGAFVAAGLTADADNDDSVSVSGAPGQRVDVDGVQARLPPENSQHLSQQKIGIDLQSGWLGELTITPSDGVPIPIPNDQLERSALDELVFQPGPGKVLEAIPSGRTCVSARIWDQVQGRANTERTESWCFNVV